MSNYTAKVILLYLSGFLILLLCGSCNSEKVNKENEGKNEVIVLDTDMGSDCDDAGALALLHSYVEKGNADLIACVYSSGKVPYGAGIVDAINHYYDRGNIPVGAMHDLSFGDPVDKMNAEKIAGDTARYNNRIIHNRDAPDMIRMVREILTGQKDHSVTYVTIGHTKGLYEILLSEPDDISGLTGRELIEKKMKRWIALGALEADNEEGHYKKDWNFFFNGTASYTNYLVKNFPADVYFINGGKNVLTGGPLSGLPEHNILRRSYEEWLSNVEGKTLTDQRPSWDLVAVYFAVEGTGKFLQMADKGYLDFHEDKGCRWIPKKNPDYRNHFYVNQKPEIESEFAAYLNEMIILSAKKN